VTKLDRSVDLERERRRHPREPQPIVKPHEPVFVGSVACIDDRHLVNQAQPAITERHKLRAAAEATREDGRRRPAAELPCARQRRVVVHRDDVAVDVAAVEPAATALDRHPVLLVARRGQAVEHPEVCQRRRVHVQVGRCNPAPPVRKRCHVSHRGRHAYTRLGMPQPAVLEAGDDVAAPGIVRVRDRAAIHNAELSGESHELVSGADLPAVGRRHLVLAIDDLVVARPHDRQQLPGVADQRRIKRGPAGLGRRHVDPHRQDGHEGVQCRRVPGAIGPHEVLGGLGQRRRQQSLAGPAARVELAGVVGVDG
jgi:hypothetical protein